MPTMRMLPKVVAGWPRQWIEGMLMWVENFKSNPGRGSYISKENRPSGPPKSEYQMKDEFQSRISGEVNKQKMHYSKT